MPYIAYWLLGWVVFLPVEKTHIEPIMTARILDPIYVEWTLGKWLVMNKIRSWFIYICKYITTDALYLFS